MRSGAHFRRGALPVRRGVVVRLTNGHLGLKRTKSEPHPESRIISLLSAKLAPFGQAMALHDGVGRRRLSTQWDSLGAQGAMEAFIVAEDPFQPYNH